MTQSYAYSFHMIGHVQGVGMRFTLKRWARKLRVSGTVQNNPDGSVSGLIQGAKDSLETFQKWLKERAPGRIDQISMSPIQVDDGMTKFQILHG